MLDNQSSSTEDWKIYWQNHPDLLSSFPEALESYQLPIYRALQQLIIQRPNTAILSAGSGQDLVSYRLQQEAGGNLSLTLLDISPEVLAWNKQLFSRANLPVNIVEGNLFKLPIANDQFDIAFNTGVLEHFTADEQIAMVREIMRVLKPGGYFITANPSASGLIYRWGMEQGKKNGTWPFGEETPIESLNFMQQRINDIELINEWNQDFVTQLNFLSYADRRWRFITWPLRWLGSYPVVAGWYDRWLAPIWGTYLLISVIQKRQ